LFSWNILIIFLCVDHIPSLVTSQQTVLFQLISTIFLFFVYTEPNHHSFVIMFKKSFLLICSILLITACAPTVPTENSADMDHGDEATVSDSDRLNNSPRHQEWVQIKNGQKTIHAWVAYPEVSEKKPVVILIHENRGLNDWARSMADQVAEAGYIAVAPDLLSDFSSTQKRTSDFADEDAARTAISALDPKAVITDLQAVADWAKTIPASNGKIASAGFCWGGAQSFQFASERDDLAVAMVFYGTGPMDTSAYENISTPVYGFYGGADARVNATIPQSEELMSKEGKTYEYEIYEGAGHAFMRLGEDTNGEPANITARNAAWERMKKILSTL
jgi:carboxymethylenebutenolidase